jgi:hypothetical protein
VRFEVDGAGLRAVVSSTGPKVGERELRTEGTDCRKLAEASAVVIALLLDIVPASTTPPFDSAPPAPTPTPAAPAPSATPAPPPPPVSSPPPPAPPREPPGPPFELRLRAEPGLAVGPLGAAVSPTFGGGVGLARGRLEAALGGAWVVPRGLPFEPIKNTRIELSLAFGYAEGCFRLTSGADRWDGSVCAHAKAGVLSVAGKHFDSDSTARELWLAAGPALALRLRLNRVLAVRGSALGLVTLGRRTFEVTGYGDAFETPPVAAAVTLGPELLIF